MKLGVSLGNVALTNVLGHVEALVGLFPEIAISKDFACIANQVRDGIVDLFFVATCAALSIVFTDRTDKTGRSGSRIPIHSF